MHMRWKDLQWLAVFLLLVLLLPQGFAHAYLDPGTGSLIIQIIVGGILGLAVSFKLFGARIMSFFKRGSSSDTVDDAIEDDELTE